MGYQKLTWSPLGAALLACAFFAALSPVEVESQVVDDFDEELYSVIDSYRDGSLWTKARQARSIHLSETPVNESYSDNSLWNDLWYGCKKKPSFKCIRGGVFKYLDKNLDGPDDLEVTDHLFFRKNKNKYEDYCENSEDARIRCLKYHQEKLRVKLETENEIGKDKTSETVSTATTTEADPEWNATTVAAGGTEDPAKSEEEQPILSLGDLSDILYDKGSRFLMTHDIELQLPETFFGGGSIKIQPKAFDVEDEDGEEGTMVKVVIKPPPPTGEVVRGRVLHQLKKLFKKKLMHSFMALMLIIKMIKVKVMFLLPMIIGQATAKKLLLKTLLFLIPGLAHLFKLCHYYHKEHAKYHHHHHKVKHHHHTVKVPVPVPVPIHHHHRPPDDSPFGDYGSPHDYPGYPSYPYQHQPHYPDHDYHDYHPSGSSHGSSVYKGEYSQYADNDAHLTSWGLGSNYHDAGVLDAKEQSNYPPYGHQGSYYKSPYPPNPYPDTSYYHNDITSSASGPQFYGAKLQLISQKPSASGSAHYIPDPFYSPIIQKIDSIFVQMGFNDEGCRERLVCSMYKSPHRFSPHSNLLSNELSRDSGELQKPVANNEDVLRFYRYVQAARDGQDQKDCLHLYHSCHINTEK